MSHERPVNESQDAYRHQEDLKHHPHAHEDDDDE